MNPVRILRDAVNAVKDPERDFSVRIFLILNLAAELTVLTALIGDIITKENPYEIMVIAATLIFVPIVTLTCLRYNRIWLGIRIIVVGLVFGILPALFFFGGGIEGGGFVWIIFGFMYAGLVLHGGWRKFMFISIAGITVACYLTAYYHPELVYPHSREMFYVDTFLSIILVGVLCYVMAWSQGRLFKEENARAKREAEIAEELTRAQSRFFSSMSHEIRTPINSILGLNELILRDQEISDEVAKDASGIQGAGKLLLALINDILDFSKMEAGSMDIVPVDYRVEDMLVEIVDMIWLRAHDKGLGLEVSVDPEVPRVLYGDEIRIKQILINLLNNAVKYTEKGHVELHVESKDVNDETVELWISVSDTGVGIKKEDLPFLFNAFKRVDEGRNRHIEGTGLGLSIVKQLIDLMDGTVSVNSVYGSGTTFTVMIRQRVSDREKVGELNLHSQHMIRRSTYESSFLAPEVRILIVDDNEMNLEVERRLLEDTDMGIDVATSGTEALEKSLKVHYDAIFMDHLMPGIDGIECLEKVRSQVGGLNRTTPVIALTANAGSENIELYRKAGFDGYLVKPVSGEAMEETLIRHIPGDKIILRSVMMGEEEEIHTSEKYAEKTPVIITSSSMCDLPDYMVRKLRIPIIPFMIKTDEGVFKDGVHMDANELIRYMSSGKDAVSAPPDDAAYTNFFADVLKRAHHVIHIAITTSMSDDYKKASEAAKAFGNVSVINSECLSSSTGLLVLIACKLVQQKMPVEDIVAELEVVKKRLKCSFIIDTTQFMARRGLVSDRLDRIASALSIHPSFVIKNDKRGLGGTWIGRTKRAYRRYIINAIPPDTIPDPEVVFVTYADIPDETLRWIEEEIRKNAYFEHVIFQQASAAVSSNCGSGTFGIMYFLKSNKSYNIASFIDTGSDETDAAAEEDVLAGSEADITDEDMSYEEDGYFDAADAFDEAEADEAPEAVSEPKWYDGLDFIDIDAAIKNSGSEEAFRTVLKIFYESIPDKYAELENSYNTGDWKNYTVKIHALKSSARLVGAMELGSAAEQLENAGKESNVQYITENHKSVMQDYLSYGEKLALLYKEEEGEDENKGSEKPAADDFIMESIYAELRSAADDMDCERISLIIKESEGYLIPDAEKDKMDLIREKAGTYDYDGILEILDT